MERKCVLQLCLVIRQTFAFQICTKVLSTKAVCYFLILTISNLSLYLPSIRNFVSNVTFTYSRTKFYVGTYLLYSCFLKTTLSGG